MRNLITLTVLLTAVAWADAQGVLTAADRLKQLQANRKLVEKLVSQGMQLANANEPLKRAEACRSVMTELGEAMENAIGANDPARVAELGDHVIAIVENGLVPNLKEAAPNAGPGSPGHETFRFIHATSTDQLQRLQTSVPRSDAMGRSAAVKTMLENWTKTRAAVDGIR